MEYRINEVATIRCFSLPAKTGFFHVGVLYLNGVEINQVKNKYLNRAWERWTFEQTFSDIAIDSLAKGFITHKEYEDIRNFIKNHK